MPDPFTHFCHSATRQVDALLLILLDKTNSRTVLYGLCGVPGMDAALSRKPPAWALRTPVCGQSGPTHMPPALWVLHLPCLHRLPCPFSAYAVTPRPTICPAPLQSIHIRPP